MMSSIKKRFPSRQKVRRRILREKYFPPGSMRAARGAERGLYHAAQVSKDIQTHKVRF